MKTAPCVYLGCETMVLLTEEEETKIKGNPERPLCKHHEEITEEMDRDYGYEPFTWIPGWQARLK